MIDVIKKTILAGVGATVVTKEKVEAVLKDLVDKGKVTAGEASELASKIAEEGRKEFETSSKELTEKVKARIVGLFDERLHLFGEFLA